jgi:hypothetical protein
MDAVNSVRGRISTPDFSMRVRNALKLRAQRDAEAMGSSELAAQRHTAGLTALSQHIDRLPLDDTILQGLWETKNALSLKAEDWSPEQARVLSRLGSQPGPAPEPAAVLAELVAAGVPDITESKAEQLRNLSQELDVVKARALELEGVEERVVGAEQVAEAAQGRIEALETEVAKLEGQVAYFREAGVEEPKKTRKTTKKVEVAA